jgi:cellulose synthase/poly-beta-1,6-N-acetylglucosamine synthase-like glycosyltransferase
MLTFGDVLVYAVSFFGLYTAIFFLLTLYENRYQLGNPKLKRFPTVSIIVPAYNEEKTIAKTLESLLALDYPKDKLKILVIDDGSKDKTFKVAKKYEARGVMVYTKKNGGKGSALNFALKKIDTELFGALDADSFVDKDALKRMVGYFENKKVMAVTPSMKVYSPKGILQSIQKIEYLFGILLRKTFAFMGCIHVTPGPFTIFRKYFFDKYGGYDEHNLTEDIEIALRIQSHDYIIENSVDAFVYTVSPKKFNPLLKQRLRWYRGFMDNVFNYKHLFSLKHGNLGAFMLPAAFISVFLILLSGFYFIFTFIKNSVKFYLNAQAVNFDIFDLNFKIDLFFFNLGPIAIISIVGIVGGITMILLAKHLSKEKESIKYSYVIYVFIYWVLYAYWWLLAIYYKTFNKKLVWGSKSL